MFSKWRDLLVRRFGLRLALWYFALFAAGAVLVLFVAGWLLQASLARRDREAVFASLVRYTDAYLQGGVVTLDQMVAADRAAATYEPVFVRVIARGRMQMLSMPIEWGRFDLNQLLMPEFGGSIFQQIEDGGDARLEVASARLPDGTLFQVGRSTARRDAILDRYRDTGLLLFAAIVVAGLFGGIALTTRALLPLQELRDTIGRILETGRTSERVPVRDSSDPLDALGVQMNRMLDRIDGLMQGMRSTLDHVAHDLRTPMTRLRGTAEMALQAAKTPEEYREALAECVEEADRVSAILDALMDLAEAETGSMRLKREPIDINAVVRDAAELYEAVADEKGVTLVVEPASGDATMTGDRVRMTQVFANLIDNAVKYTPAPGLIRITVTPRPDAVDVVVADTGPGISAEDQPRIWERLYRGDASRSSRGLGIGLSLVRAIVEAHGGRVTVESAPGSGSRFNVYLRR